MKLLDKIRSFKEKILDRDITEISNNEDDMFNRQNDIYTLNLYDPHKEFRFIRKVAIDRKQLDGILSEYKTMLRIEESEILYNRINELNKEKAELAKKVAELEAKLAEKNNQ